MGDGKFVRVQGEPSDEFQIPGVSEAPTYSPDGKWIAFTSDRGGGDNLWIMDANGGNARQVSKESFRLLSQAAALVASPQIRNQGTLGGNVSQDTRCWYYRSGWTCYRAGGNICYADTPTAINREHAIFDANRCVAVNPSDTAPALIALDAQMVIRSSGSERVVDAQNYFIGPSVDITRMTVLQPGELLTAIRIPAAWAGAEFYFEKIRERQVWDFPLVNIAAALKVSNGTISGSRVVVNAVAAHPMRLTAVEDAIAGKPRNEETAAMAGDLAARGARPLAHNGYKIPLVKNLVKRAIRGEAQV